MKLTKLEREVGKHITVKRWGMSTGRVMLTVGVQSFQIATVGTHPSEAQWMRRQLRKALVNLVNEVKP